MAQETQIGALYQPKGSGMGREIGGRFKREGDICIPRASLIVQLVNHLPAMQKTQVRFLGREGPLEKEMAVHSSILAWRIPWTKEPGRLQTTQSQELDMT